MYRARPYIGIVGIKNADEAIEVSKLIQKMDYKKSGHMIQMGVQVTPLVVNGVASKGIGIRSSEGLGEVADIFECTREILGDVFNVVHYSERDKSNLVQRIGEIFDTSGIFSTSLCRAIQLNGYLDDIRVDDLARIKKHYYQLKIIMQINHQFVNSSNAYGVVHKLLQISRFIDYVLIDSSGGAEMPMSINKSINLAKAIRNEIRNLGIGFSGGFNGENSYFNILKLRQLLKNKDFSVDAESGLRDGVGDGCGDDNLNIGKVKRYVADTLAAFGKDSNILNNLKK